MNVKVRYFSKLGNTKKIAEAMASALNIEAKSIVDEAELKDYTDILFLGGAPYANVMDPKLKKYASDLNPNMVKRVVLFTTSNWSKRTVKGLKKILREKGIEVDEEFFYAQMLNIKNRTEPAKEFVLNIVK
ncbi:MAG: flavodoxin [Gammaproteobacteria bacterium]|nr:flavodoxin [Gammaproteobacteria bacterium]